MDERKLACHGIGDPMQVAATISEAYERNGSGESIAADAMEALARCYKNDENNVMITAFCCSIINASMQKTGRMAYVDDKSELCFSPYLGTDERKFIALLSS